MRKIIVIGASAASISFMTKLRTFDKTSEIICFSGEKHMPYNRCFLADVLSKEKSKKAIQLKPEDFYEKNEIQLKLDCWVDSIDFKEKKVFIGEMCYEYNYLFLGTGSGALKPPFYKENTPGLFTFHTLEDIEKITNFIEKNEVQHVAVIGAGLNGLECSFALSEIGLSVSLVDGADRVLSCQVDLETSQYIESLMKNKVRFHGSSLVEEVIVEGGAISRIQCTNGEKIAVDMVICATGSRVQSGLVKGGSLQMHNHSIIVDSTLKTSDPSVFAAGDVVFTEELVSECKKQSMTWSDAMLQGLCAATQLSEKPRKYAGLIGMRDSEFFDHSFYACGETVGTAKYEVIEKRGAGYFHRLYLEDCCLKGFVLVGNVDSLPLYRQLFLTQKKVPEKL